MFSPLHFKLTKYVMLHFPIITFLNFSKIIYVLHVNPNIINFMFNGSFNQIEEYTFSILLKTAALDFVQHVAASYMVASVVP